MSNANTEGKKMVTVIQTMCRENYAAHNGFDGNFHWKNKAGSTYVVESTHPADIAEVVSLIEDEPNDVHYEYIVDRFIADADYESEFVKSQKEYDSEGWDTLYCDNVVRKGTNGHWYMKRGYVVGMFQKDAYPELAGKFNGWVDDLTTGECKCRIVGTEKLPLEKEAA
jgi:hypothetical protein